MKFEFQTVRFNCRFYPNWTKNYNMRIFNVRYAEYDRWLRLNFTWQLSSILGAYHTYHTKKADFTWQLSLILDPQLSRFNCQKLRPWQIRPELSRTQFLTILLDNCGTRGLPVLSDDVSGSIPTCDMYFRWPYAVSTVRYCTVRFAALSNTGSVRYGTLQYASVMWSPT